MQFTKRSLEKFKLLYSKYFGEELPEKEVLQKATYLLEVFKVVYELPNAVSFFNKNEETE